MDLAIQLAKKHLVCGEFPLSISKYLIIGPMTDRTKLAPPPAAVTE
jgi:hypothetical protein